MSKSRKALRYGTATAVSGLYVAAGVHAFKTAGQEQPKLDPRRIAVASGLLIALTWVATLT